MKKILKGVLIAAGVLVLLVLVFPTMLILSEGGFRYSEEFKASSPDGADQLTILKRTAFPSNEIVDPSIIVKLRLNGKSDTEQTVKLIEDSDLIAVPTVEWGTDSVTVSGLSTRRDISIRLKRNN